MAYITEQQLIDRFGERELIALTDFDNVGQLDSDTLNRAIAAAGAEIDGYLADRYSLPVSSNPERLVDIAADLVRCRLYTHDAPDYVTEACKVARRWLEGVAAGRWSVPGLGAKPGAGAAGSPQVSAPDRLFSSDTLKDF